MKVSEFLSNNCIKIGLQSKTKKEVLEELVDVLVSAGKVKDKMKVLQVLIDREELGSTGIGQGVAIPHGRTDDVENPVAVLGLSREGIHFDTLDGDPVNIFYLLLAPQSESGTHLKSLARISGLLKDKYFRKNILDCQSAEGILEVIASEEKLKK